MPEKPNNKRVHSFRPGPRKRWSKLFGTIVRLIPERIQVALYRSILAQRTEKREAGTVPVVDLPIRCMRNTELLPDRIDLLRKMPGGGVVAELGVESGAFSRDILDLNKPQKLYLIDSWNSRAYPGSLQDVVKREFEKEIEDGIVQVIRGRSFEEITRFEDHTFDWLYIDTDHSYSTTRKELEAVAPKIKEGGLICGHDYCPVNWMFGELYGVIPAVNEFCVTHGWELIYLTNESHRNLSYAIRKVIDQPAP